MPELPEVQVTLNLLKPGLLNQTIQQVVFRTNKLRWPLDLRLTKLLVGLKIKALSRRGKYLLLETLLGDVVIHLGMSGSLRLESKELPPRKHDYVELELENAVLRFSDPRKFGAFLWFKPHEFKRHKLCTVLGVEPLDEVFDAAMLHQLVQHKKMPLKPFLMHNKHLVGVGNIYASESLFMAKLDPRMPAKDLSLAQCQSLVLAIKSTLNAAIALGGTSVRDFVMPDGTGGHFGQQLAVYGREGQACAVCGEMIIRLVQAQRSTFYCKHCQEAIVR